MITLVIFVVTVIVAASALAVLIWRSSESRAEAICRVVSILGAYEEMEGRHLREHLAAQGMRLSVVGFYLLLKHMQDMKIISCTLQLRYVDGQEIKIAIYRLRESDD